MEGWRANGRAERSGWRWRCFIARPSRMITQPFPSREQKTPQWVRRRPTVIWVWSFSSLEIEPSSWQGTIQQNFMFFGVGAESKNGFPFFSQLWVNYFHNLTSNARIEYKYKSKIFQAYYYFTLRITAIANHDRPFQILVRALNFTDFKLQDIAGVAFLTCATSVK